LIPLLPARPRLLRLEPIESYEEKIEPLRNESVELRLTNRGGGISEAHLLNHAAEGRGHGRVLNSPIIRPSAQSGAADCASAAGVHRRQTRTAACMFERRRRRGRVRSASSFRDDGEEGQFVAEMQIDFRNEGAAPYKRGLLPGLGSTVRRTQTT
jgi:hypothetical protein